MVPANLTLCSAEPTPPLPEDPAAWANNLLAGIIADQRASALSKGRCADDWQSFYLDLSKRLK